MQSPNVPKDHKTEPEGTITSLIVGSTDMDIQDPTLPAAEGIKVTEEKPSPQPANSIVMQTEGNPVMPSEQASLGQQVRYHKAMTRAKSG
jgi:hypothetical protein